MSDANVFPSASEFSRLAQPGRIVPVAIEIPFDLDTPVTAFSKLRREPFSFLLESVEGGDRWARFSFLGSSPREAWRLDGSEIRRWTPAEGWGAPDATDDPFAAFERWITRFEPVAVPGLPRFWGGAVGFFGYDTVRWIERLPDAPPDDLGVPDACFMATEYMLIVDNVFPRALAVAAVPVEPEGADPAVLHEQAYQGLADWVRGLERPHGLERLGTGAAGTPEVSGNRSRDDYEQAVARIREYIVAGDAYQVVVSQRAEARFGGDPLELYRALRRANPSPYLFFIELDGVRLIGSSPETLVRVEDGNVTVRPIAGTRPRGATPAEDERHARDLLADEKERAEHLMLVDLGRNDVGRVAQPGSVEVTRFMEIEHYSHVMHLVSEVAGALRPGVDAVAAFQACFPAGTLTGAPKVRAMEIIDELEPTRRGPYGGAAGYVGYGAESLDMAIIIRTLLSAGERVYAQAGAGIVYDSVAANEWEETRHKARVLLEALAEA